MGKRELYEQIEMFFPKPGAPMIFDGPHLFPKSSVEFTKYKSFELRQLFAYLRQREQILQSEVKKSGQNEEKLRLQVYKVLQDSDEARVMISMLKLMITEEMLGWMVSNVTGLEEDRIF